MSEHDIEYELRDRIAWITINRPERRNALTRHNMSVDLPDTWLRFEADEEARIAIISGAGEFAFCAGMDVKERAGAFERSADGGASEQTRETRVSPRANGVTKPVIGAVNGVCTGVGMQIVARLRPADRLGGPPGSATRARASGWCRRWAPRSWRGRCRRTRRYGCSSSVATGG